MRIECPECKGCGEIEVEFCDECEGTGKTPVHLCELTADSRSGTFTSKPAGMGKINCEKCNGKGWNRK